MKENILNNKNLILTAIICLVLGFYVGMLHGAETEKNKMNEEMDHMGMQMDHSKMTANDVMNSDMHKHEKVAAGSRIPTINMTATPDTMGGYNVNITTTNFTFTPQSAGKDNSPNTGHAHIYVNGTKVGRVYGNWIYLGPEKFKKGENLISVTLNGNNHDVWVLQDGTTEITATSTVVVQ